MSARPTTPTKVVEPGGEVLPGYRVVQLLTHGRRLDTYDCFDLDRGCRVVVKTLRPDRCHDDRVREAVLQEARLVTELAHPHLVRGYARFDEPPAMVLETLTGATLGRLVEDGPLAPSDVALLGSQLASVLSYLHRHDWLHLDVKPANVVVRGGIAVLIDLSLARRPGEGRPGAGTRGYLAPEQALGRGLCPATDVWGLGVTLLEALTGELAHGDEATWESRRRWPLVGRRAPGLPYGGALPGDVPREWRATLLACLDRDPAARPRLVDVAAALSAC